MLRITSKSRVAPLRNCVRSYALVLAKETMDRDEPVVSDWHLWCRLCAKEEVEGNINVFFKGAHRDDEQLVADINLATTIEHYFGVTIISGELSEMLCPECFSLLTAMSNFSERVAKVQQLYKCLQEETIISGTAIDLHAARLKYGLLNSDREPLPEMHYYEAKPKLNELETEFVGEVESATPQKRQRIKKENLPEEAVAVEENEYYLDEEAGEEEEEEFVGEPELNAEERDPFPFNDDAGEYQCSEDAAEEEILGGSDYEDTQEDCIDSQETTALENDAPVKADECDAAKTMRQTRQKVRKRKLEAEEKSDIEGANRSARKSTKANSRRSLDQSYSCGECARKFIRFHHYREHMKRAHSQTATMPELACPDCPRVFTAQHQLNWHARKHLPAEMKNVVPCPYCEKKFSSNTLVQTHVKHVHMNERSFICEECGVAVRTAAALKTHMLTHTDYAPFICEICQKGFKDHIRLKNHKEIHDPNKHICAECGLQLNSRATLNRHLLVHSDEMKHKCDYCGRAFKRAKALKSHLILHTGLKPYTCDFCDRTFGNGSNCRSHKKKAHPEELAKQEAAGGKTNTPNIPKLETLKAVTKAADNLTPVVSKRSGCFSGKRPKEPVAKSTRSGNNKLLVTATQTEAVAQSDLLAAVAAIGGESTAIPTIDNIYNIMKQTGRQHQQADATLQIKRSPSQASAASCTALEQNVSSSSSGDTLQLVATQLHLQQQNFYPQQQPHTVLDEQQQQHGDLSAIRSPSVQADNGGGVAQAVNEAAHFYGNQPYM